MFNTAAIRHEESPEDRNDALRNAFADRSAIGYARARDLPVGHETDQTSDTVVQTGDHEGGENDNHSLQGPKPHGEGFEGLLRRIQSLIQNRQSIDAINLALEVREKFPDLSDAHVEKLYAKIDEALPYIHLDGTFEEALLIKRRLITDSGISTNWDANVLSLDDIGFSSVLQNIRAMNASSARLPEDLGLVERVPSLAPAA